MIPRDLAPHLLTAYKQFPIVGVVGPRQSGKSTLVRDTFVDLPYVNLERPDDREMAIDDPIAFLGRFPQGAIIDEIQRAPQLPSYLQVAVDERGRAGQFVLTGSQHFLMMEQFSQSLAGRIALFRLLPFSLGELYHSALPGDLFSTLFSGFYPRIHDQQIPAAQWLESYVETYVERDVRTLRDIGDLRSFARFLRLCAGRAGGLLNLSSLAHDAGVAVNTAKAWLSVLEASFIVFLLPPHHRGFKKRLVKAPKLHFWDVGLACYLLGIQNPSQLMTHAKRGDLFEGFVVAELLKARHHRRCRWEINFWRDKTGHELDALIEDGERYVPIEVKAGQTLRGEFFRNLDYWIDLSQLDARGLLIYGGDEDQRRTRHDGRSWRALRDPVAMLGR